MGAYGRFVHAVLFPIKGLNAHRNPFRTIYSN
jgi:hypothetical protein